MDAVQERSEVNDALSLAGLEARQAGGGSHSRRWAYLTFLGAADASYSIAVSYFGQLAVIPGMPTRLLSSLLLLAFLLLTSLLYSVAVD